MSKKPKNDGFFEFKKGRRSHVALTYEILDSRQWQALSKAAQLSYINILRNYNGFNSKEIKCPRDGLVCKLGSNSWLNGTKELEKAGFVRVIRKSGINHHPNLYTLSNDWKKKR